MTLEECLLHHLRASGPCTFKSLLWYAHTQATEDVEDVDVAMCLTNLIREGKVCLYDTGEAFDYDHFWINYPE